MYKPGVNLKIIKVMAALKDSTESLSTAVWGRWFQSTMLRWKNYAFPCWVLHNGTWYDWECMFLECLRGGESLALLLTATLSWEILYIMRGCASLCRSSRLHHSRCCSIKTRCISLSVGDIHFCISQPSVEPFLFCWCQI
jgi:hypothetical protein